MKSISEIITNALTTLRNNKCLNDVLRRVNHCQISPTWEPLIMFVSEVRCCRKVRNQIISFQEKKESPLRTIPGGVFI